MKPADLSGLTSATTCANLARLAATVPKSRAILEIGTFRGKSACALASKAKGHVWTIDPWDLEGNIKGKHDFNNPALREVFAYQVDACGLSDKITHIKGFSPQVASDWDGPAIGLIFLDGDHEYESIVADFAAWQDKLTDGAGNSKPAVVVFDDLDTPRNPGVRQFFDEVALDNKRQLKDNLGVGEYVGG